MNIQTLTKILIIVGIAAIILVVPIIGFTQYSLFEREFGPLFVNKDAKIQEFKQSEPYKLFKEKWPDATERDRNHSRYGGAELHLQAFDFDTGNRLNLRINHDWYNDQTWQYIDCDIRENSLRKKLGFISTATEEDKSKFPEIFLKDGRAEEEFVVGFIKYTNCLDMGNDEMTNTVEDKKTTHYIAIPEGTGSPGCEETNECYSPYSLTIKVGNVVEWQNFDEAAHTVTSGDPQNGPTSDFDTGLFMSQESFKVEFEEAGVFPYFCMVHPWMTGVVAVIGPEPSDAIDDGFILLE